MSSAQPQDARHRRVPFWLLGSVIAVVVSIAGTASYYQVRDTKPVAPTRVLGQQFTASTSSGNTAAGNNGCGIGNGGPSGSKDCSNSGHPIVVNGSVLGVVYPGTSTTLRLRITNPNNQDMTLQRATVAIGAPSPGGCLASWFNANGYTGSPAITLRKNSTTQLDLGFSMVNLPISQDVCKTATIPLSFSATAG